MSQSSEFSRHNPLCCFLTVFIFVVVDFVIDCVRKLLDIPSYTSSVCCLWGNRPPFLYALFVCCIRATCSAHLIYEGRLKSSWTGGSADVMQRVAVTVMTSCGGGGDVVVA
jgi:hypothetical protein